MRPKRNRGRLRALSVCGADAAIKTQVSRKKEYVLHKKRIVKTTHTTSKERLLVRLILLIPYQHSVSLLPFPIHCGMVRLVNFVLWLSRTKSYMQRRAHIATDLPAASCVARPLRNRKRFYSCGGEGAYAASGMLIL